ncbi:helix-turn-helix transcriptional regulator [Parasphingorhabdus cellanae]|uniref:Helix-turn-helix transcriptional regulator n=1 Tax=Parasphingorhabdus cellanae TaxID=2806553 RepID=A0ABX7T1Q6_9SPHN|nr:AraC family transcriptional regulator [Parasphingorhabdus cellanae]QTD54452.1 helix-turn-helix transcriptional regulator [Parasphingorhabdus cellanae]
MIDEFDDFSERAHIDSEEAPMGGGAVWSSDRQSGPSGQFEATLPAGLHISIGKAGIRTHSEKYGGFESTEPCLSFVKIEEDGAFFNSQLDGGAIRSLGYFLPPQAFESAGSVLQLINETAQNKPMVLLKGGAMIAATRLLCPLGDEFQGDVRTMLLQARVLELIALIGSTIEPGMDKSICPLSQRRARKARDYIEAHLDSQLELLVLARHCQVSERTLTHAFRATFDESVMHYVARRRMEQGAQNLQEGANIAAAAYSVGYTPNAFSAAFKKHFGMSPSHYNR